MGQQAVLVCRAGPCHVVVLLAHRQARVSRTLHSRTKPSRLVIKLHSSVANWLERERQTGIYRRYDLSTFCLARGVMARQTGDEVAVLKRMMLPVLYLLCPSSCGRFYLFGERQLSN